MWQLVRELRASGVTIILTTHYIEEAEEMADRVGVINKGEIILVEDKAELMRKLGKKQLTLELREPLDAIPAALAGYKLTSPAAARSWSTPTTPRASAPASPRCSTTCAARASSSRICDTTQSSLEDIFVGLVRQRPMNLHAVRAIYMYEMARTGRTLFQSVVSPVISTSLYFIVFGAAIGSRITQIDGVRYGAFIVPGLIMLMLLTQSVTNASFGIYFPRFVGTIYELLSAPVSPFEIVLGYVGAAATKSIILGLMILATSGLFVPLHIEHPLWMVAFLVLTAVSFSLFGFILGIWADGFEKLQIVPLLIITPLTFLGGTFYSTSVLPPLWRTVTLFNPMVYLISGFRWSFFGIADVDVEVSLGDDADFPGDLHGDRLVVFPDRIPAEELERRPIVASLRQGRNNDLLSLSEIRRRLLRHSRR